MSEPDGVTRTIAIPVTEEAAVTGILTRPEICRPGVTPGLLLAHGANNDLSHPLLAAVAAR
ncbi:MAG: hypothetical protein M1325_05010, partial [Actinobacteria bacterium]|nr:hypothetical protein [Actinomycetota bacterium]